jgi:hypothetical protein
MSLNNSQVKINHLQQMITFTRGTGVEFLPVIDPSGARSAFIQTLVTGNRLDLMIPQMISHMLGKGRILLELYPNGYSHRTPYRIRHYTPDCYRVEADEYGDIAAAKYCYPYRRIEPGAPPRVKWVCLRVTPGLIEFADLDNKPNLDQEIPAQSTAKNPLGYLPYVEVLNPPPAGGELGDPDFKMVESHLQIHDEVTGGIAEKILEFCYNPLVTNKSAGELYQGMYQDSTPDQRNSVAYMSGFEMGPTAPPPRFRKLKKVFGDFEPDDRLEQLQINPIPQDHQIFAADYERQLREALGGILERGIETATESRVVYGKVAATARDKQLALFKYGICEILSFAILAEEAVFVATKGLQGIPPAGDRSVSYRVGSVFMPTADDTLKRSIVGRNLTEVGVNAKETMKWIFPEKTEAEIDMMVGSGGVPIRYLSQIMQMFSQATALTDPATGAPYVDPLTGLTIAQSFIPFILNALAYGQQFNSPPNQSGTSAERYYPAAVNAAVIRASQQRGNAEPIVSTSPLQSGGDVDRAQPIDSGPIPDPGASTRRGGGFLDLTRSPILQFFNGLSSREY